MSATPFGYFDTRNPIVQFMTGQTTYEGEIQSNGKPSIVSTLNWDGSYSDEQDRIHAQNALKNGVDRILIQFIQEHTAPKPFRDEYIPTVGIEMSGPFIVSKDTNGNTSFKQQSRKILILLEKKDNEWKFSEMVYPGYMAIDPSKFMDFVVDGNNLEILITYKQYYKS